MIAPIDTVTAASWPEAHAKVVRFAAGLPTYLGTGYPIAQPHVVYKTMDAWSGEGMGYVARRYPNGDNGCTYGPNRPECQWLTVHVRS